MERRNLVAGGVALLLALLMLCGTASAHKAMLKTAAGSAEGCVVTSLPSFMDQGEEGIRGAAPSSVADVIGVECERRGQLQYGGRVRISDLQLYNRCNKQAGTVRWFTADGTRAGSATEGVEVALDGDGNATVALIATNCRPGETTVVADETEYPFETYMATFTVLAPEVSPEGLWVLPSREVESVTDSSVVTIVEVEFPAAEALIDLVAEQLYDRCSKATAVEWVLPSGTMLTSSGRLELEVETDDDGNAFALLFGRKSCQPGAVQVFGDLVEAESFQTVHDLFEIEYPRPTVQ